MAKDGQGLRIEWDMLQCRTLITELQNHGTGWIECQIEYK